VLEAGTTTSRRGRRTVRSRRRLLLQRSLPIVTLLGALALLGLVFAGSGATLAPGVRIAGIDVGGLTPHQARVRLARRELALANTPVIFTSGNRTWSIRPASLGVTIDTRAAVDAARRHGQGFGPFRGFRRLAVSLFGANVQPPVRVWRTALKLELDRITSGFDRPHRDAAIRLRGLRLAVVPAQAGVVLDRRAAAVVLVRGLSSFERKPIALPVRVDRPRVTAADLAPAATEIRTALSAPVGLKLGLTRWRLNRYLIASLLEPPHGGLRRLHIAGTAAHAYFVALAKRVGRPPVDARFAVDGPKVTIVPGMPGRTLDVAATAKNLLAAVLSPSARLATVVVGGQQPARSTADLQALGVTGLVSSYETLFGGVANRIHNVEVVSHLIDDQLIAPGKEWSFNRATGARTAGKGFLVAPVIINGEVQTGLGGGVCQVSTTVFNAVYEAGLKITARTNHALYIPHYPLGRDATVDYPSVDLKFVNDTGHWLLLRTFASSSSLNVSLYGALQHRKVETQTQPLSVVGPAPLKPVPDPTLPRGKKVVENTGVPAQATTVERKVYASDGKLLYDDTFHSSYQAEPGLIRVGTKKLVKATSRPPLSVVPLPPLQQ
jgi:vancomycin resistance protein YoaR